MFNLYNLYKGKSDILLEMLNYNYCSLSCSSSLSDILLEDGTDLAFSIKVALDLVL